MKSMLFAAAGAAILAAPAAAQAEAQQLYFDPNHTQISVGWEHYAGAPLTFFFTEFDGELMYDPENAENSSANVTVDIPGIWTGVEDFKNHLLSGDFFEAETYPEASFTSTEIEYTSDTTATMTGDLTIKDITAPVTFDVEMVGEHTDDEGATTRGFTATTELDRTEWGLGYAAPMVPETVTLTIATELKETDPAAE